MFSHRGQQIETPYIHKSQYEDAITVNSELKSAYDAAADDDA